MIKSLKDLAFDFRIKAGYTSAFVLLLISYILTLYGNNQLMKQTAWVYHTNEIIRNLETLASGMKDAETSLRGYVVTKDSNFLLPYKNSFTAVDNAFAKLNSQTLDNQVQQQNLKELTKLITNKYDILKFIIDYFPKNNYQYTDTLLKNTYKCNALMVNIRLLTAKMQSNEEELLKSRTQDLAARYKALNTIIISSLILALIFAIFGFYTYRREYNGRLAADKKVEDYQAELNKRIAELDDVNRELILMKRSEKFAATGRIARTIAHEVRNPLTNIDLAVSQIKNDLGAGDDNIHMLFDMVDRNSKRINQLISELLSATRFAELSYESVSINTLLDEALEMAKDRINLKQIQIHKQYSSDICNIAVDPDKVKIAFLNLIVNAIEAMKDKEGILQINTRGENGKCVVEIIDNGYGIPEGQLNNLFEPYFTTKANGNGLGLTNTQNIILNHKGFIGVHSKTGEGTTFIIKFDFTTPA